MSDYYPRHRDQALPASPNFPSIEAQVLDYWKRDQTFQASIDARPAGANGENEFVFYDGPPFANGLPHYGHLLTGYVKDIVGRYQTQRGKRVERRFGWDTHGLPAEIEAEKILEITDKSEIEKIGIGKFNDTCRSSVLRYTREWEEYVTRQARWVDFDRDYKTLDPTFMESVLWAFKTLHDKGLAYEGHKVLPYCWNDQTPLSNHELKMDDDVYQNRQDNTVTVGLRLETGELALIWTTTPWTLPSNLAIAVGPAIEYSVVEPTEGPLAGQAVILASARVEAYAKELGENPRVVKTLPGSELVGRRYTPIFDYFENAADNPALENPGPRAWQIISGEFVTTDDGTGLVHIAPAFGEDDMAICVEAGISAVVPVDEGGRFTSAVHDYAGTQVFDANKQIITDLRDATGPHARREDGQRAVLVRQQSYEHSYPHCWRCRKPLIYKAVSSWFVAVTKIRQRMVELNQQINWVPSHIKDGQFGKWLEGARDWSISRNRYWGAPIPVWKSDDPAYPRVDVYGSYAELARDFGVDEADIDLHRPAIDKLTRPNPDDPTGKSTMRRIPDVLDCWFESGSMPFAQVHYPFENQDWFEDHYPGDFIVEYVGQTRGWFYTLHVLATALFDRPAFTNCVSHGIVLGNDGRKMSKSLRNYPDVTEVLDRDGADAMRWFLMSSPILRGGNLIVTEEGIRDSVRQVLLPLWNTWYFFALYSGTCNGGRGLEAHAVKPGDVAGLDVMDRYLLASLAKLTDTVREQMDLYDIPGATHSVREFMDLLTNWYVRTSRQRFWDENQGAFDTLYTALEGLTRLLAPLAPLVSEEIWRGLTGGRSVHLTDWPAYGPEFYDGELVDAMNRVRETVSTTLGLRKSAKIRVRQPLGELTVVVENPRALEPFTALIASEVNIKRITLVEPADSSLQVSRDLVVLPREFDPGFRRLTSQIFAAAKTGKWGFGEDGASVVFPEIIYDGAALQLREGQYELVTRVELGEDTVEGEAVAAVLAGGGFAVLDTIITEQLAAEGYARDVIRAVQEERKNSGLHVSDRIELHLTVPAEKVKAAREHLELIKAETLTLRAEVTEGQKLAVRVAPLSQER